MRFILACFALLGCGTDTFTSGDGSSSDAPIGSDGNMIVEGGGMDGGGDVRIDGPSCAWCPQSSPTNKNLYGVAGVANNAVIIVGDQTAYWWSGSWTSVSVGGAATYTLRAVSMFDNMNIWAAGDDGNTGMLVVGSYMGLAPPGTAIPVKPNQYNAVVRNAMIGIAAGTQNGSNTILYGTGGGWSYGDGTTSYFGLDAEGATNAIAVGSGKVATFKGSWSEIALNGTHYAVAGNSNQGWIAGAGGEILHYTITSGMITTSPINSNTSDDLHGIRLRPNGDVYAVGRNGTIVLVKNGTSSGTPQPSGTGQDLNAIWGDPNGMWVVGNGGTILRHP